jgi:hypothetical protein
MTTIATDGITIAADTASFFGNILHRKDKTKLVVRHGRIYTISGTAAILESAIKWHHAGADPNDAPKHGDWNLLVIDRDAITLFASDVPYPTLVEPPFAMGTGDSLAIGAMDAGCTPEQAVRIAIRRDANTDGDVQVLKIADHVSILKEAAE